MINVIGIFLAVICALLSYILTNSIIVTIIVALSFLIYFLFVLTRRFKKYQDSFKLERECYSFINNFIASLNVKGTINAALESVYLTANNDIKNELDGLNEANSEEKIAYLDRHFRTPLYSLFTDLINIYVNEGGDIIKMSQNLIEQVQNREDYLLYLQSLNRSKAVEFTILYSFVIVILFALRYSLNSYFVIIASSLFFKIGVSVIFAFMLLSIEFFTQKMFQIGGMQYEKN
mgnify:CR=1 FL=1